MYICRSERTSFTHYAVPRPGSWVCVFEYHFSFPHIAYFFSLQNLHWYLKVLLLQMKWNYLCIGFCALPFICGSQCFTYAGGIIVHAYICRNWNKNDIAAAKIRGKFELLLYCLNLTIGRYACFDWSVWGSLMAVGKCRQLYANTDLLQLTLFCWKRLLIFPSEKTKLNLVLIQTFVLRLRWCGLWYLISIVPTVKGSFCQIVLGLLIIFF